MYTCKALYNLMLPRMYEELVITLEHRVQEYSGSLLLKGNPGLQHIKILVMVDKPGVVVTRDITAFLVNLFRAIPRGQLRSYH